MPIRLCPKCNRDTNSVWIDDDGCYLTPIPDENGYLYWRRGCISKNIIPILVQIAKQSINKPILVNGEHIKKE